MRDIKAEIVAALRDAGVQCESTYAGVTIGELSIDLRMYPRRGGWRLVCGDRLFLIADLSRFKANRALRYLIAYIPRAVQEHITRAARMRVAMQHNAEYNAMRKLCTAVANLKNSQSGATILPSGNISITLNLSLGQLIALDYNAKSKGERLADASATVSEILMVTDALEEEGKVDIANAIRKAITQE